MSAVPTLTPTGLLSAGSARKPIGCDRYPSAAGCLLAGFRCGAKGDHVRVAHPLFEFPAGAVTWAVVADFLSLRLRESFSVEYKARPVPRVLSTVKRGGHLD